MLESPEFWVAVGFVLLVAGIARPAARSITTALDARSARIEASLDEARKLREEAQHLLTEYQRKQRDAARESRQIVEQARIDAERIAAAARADLERALERREAVAREKIARAEVEALRGIRALAIDIAIAATERVIAERLAPEQARSLIDSAIAELPGQIS